MKKVLFILVLTMTFVVSTTSADKGGVAPFQGAFNYCVDKHTSLADTRAECVALWSDIFGWDVEPPVVVTHCPKGENNGKKDTFTPNGFCPIDCGEGEVEISCTVRDPS
jgi:hypothetical protein